MILYSKTVDVPFSGKLEEVIREMVVWILLIPAPSIAFFFYKMIVTVAAEKKSWFWMCIIWGLM